MGSGHQSGRGPAGWTLGGNEGSLHARDGAARPRSALMADEDAWERAGAELRRVDPQRFAAVLKVVEDICSIHRDPLCHNLAAGHFIFDAGDDDGLA
jgi:hypothetical protein